MRIYFSFYRRYNKESVSQSDRVPGLRLFILCVEESRQRINGRIGKGKGQNDPVQVVNAGV
jgi:hypothetical protein